MLTICHSVDGNVKQIKLTEKSHVYECNEWKTKRSNQHRQF